MFINSLESKYLSSVTIDKDNLILWISKQNVFQIIQLKMKYMSNWKQKWKFPTWIYNQVWKNQNWQWFDYYRETCLQKDIQLVSINLMGISKALGSRFCWYFIVHVCLWKADGSCILAENRQRRPSCFNKAIIFSWIYT